MIAKSEPILLRKMTPTESDFRLFLKWMTDPETMKYWDGLTEKYTYERVERQYWENIEEQVEQCIIEYDGRPIGYCQFSLLTAPEYEVPQAQYDQFADPGERIYGIDIFLGETDDRDRGIGTQCMKLLMQTLFEQYHADGLMIDPKVHNLRAIRCYQKCGFRDLFVVPQREMQDGVAHDSLIMGIKKVEFTEVAVCTKN